MSLPQFPQPTLRPQHATICWGLPSLESLDPATWPTLDTLPCRGLPDMEPLAPATWPASDSCPPAGVSPNLGPHLQATWPLRTLVPPVGVTRSSHLPNLHTCQQGAPRLPLVPILVPTCWGLPNRQYGRTSPRKPFNTNLVILPNTTLSESRVQHLHNTARPTRSQRPETLLAPVDFRAPPPLEFIDFHTHMSCGSS